MNKALFLDRDGVINIEKNYLYKIKDFEFIDGVFELCKYYQNLGYIIVVVTNQSGIARKYYDEYDFELLTSWMQSEFLKKDIEIKKVYHCPHHPDISGVCSCRKPKSGMLKEAKKEFNIDLSSSVMLGDKERDIEAGIDAGVLTTYLFDENSTTKSSKATKIISRFEEIYDADT
ncbi:MAG: D-glycero-beta-D-manno-heptose 1,7-bisphosphate 7-phosphatase [Sulfurimonas sp.]|nr:D-glycero-beta-D-manno-heptose 1,7-bisphosphate 7-phosphatase [Sulfurimonas sp.]